MLYFRLVLLYRRLRYFVVSPPCIAILAAPVLCCISALYYYIGGSGSLLYLRLVRRGKTFNREPFRLGDVTVEASTSVRNLGAYIDSDMSMTTHINHLVRTCFYNLRRIKHIRRFITTKTAILLIYRRLRYFVVSPPCIDILAAPVLCCISALYYYIGGYISLFYLHYVRLRYLHNVACGGSMHVFGSTCVTVKAIL